MAHGIFPQWSELLNCAVMCYLETAFQLKMPALKLSEHSYPHPSLPDLGFVNFPQEKAAKPALALLAAPAGCNCGVEGPGARFWFLSSLGLQRIFLLSSSPHCARCVAAEPGGSPRCLHGQPAASLRESSLPLRTSPSLPSNVPKAPRSQHSLLCSSFSAPR